MKTAYKKLYRAVMKTGIGREAALNVTLIRMGLKCATTVLYNQELVHLLRREKFTMVVDTSYLLKRIHGFLECVTSTVVPGAPRMKRVYISADLPRPVLEKMTYSTDFFQGHYFGFPVCCMLNYCRKSAQESKSYVDIFTNWLSMVPEKEGIKYLDYRLVGILAKGIVPVRLIQHIPCRHDCRESVELAQKNLSVLEELDPDFKRSVTKGYKKTFLVYGNTWEEAALVQLDAVRRIKGHRYACRCLASLPEGKIPLRSRIEVRLVPHRSVEISTGNGRELVNLSSVNVNPWSYCLLQPYDSLK